MIEWIVTAITGVAVYFGVGVLVFFLYLGIPLLVLFWIAKVIGECLDAGCNTIASKVIDQSPASYQPPGPNKDDWKD